MTNQTIQDSISLQLSAEQTVTNETVKITVAVNAILTDPNEAQLRADIRKALSGLFAKEPDWKFANQQRFEDSGYERVSLQAVSRVAETENYDLKNRLDRISKQGLKFQLVNVDDSIPQAKIEEAEFELRGAILEKVKKELDAMKQTTGRDYRIGSVTFGRAAEIGGSKNMTASNMVLYAAAAPGAGMHSGGGDEALGNSQKLVLTANVVLSVLVPTYAPIPITNAAGFPPGPR